MSTHETSVPVKSGKYTFIIKENTFTREEEIMYTSLQIGGDYPDCVSIFIYYTDNNPSSAKMPHAMYDEDCVDTTNNVYLEKGDGSRTMIQTLISYIRQKYPTITDIEFDDMSSIECAADEEITRKPMSLYNLSIAYNGQTWYEKYFGARHQNMELHTKYRERVATLLYDKAIKPTNYNDFIKITRIPQSLWIEVFEYYKQSETYSKFFHLIPKPERCRLLRPWIDTFMAHYLKKSFTNMDWTIPTLVRGGKKNRKTRRKTIRFYIPKNIQLNKVYQPNLGVSMDDL
jgi:hypothetical protein